MTEPRRVDLTAVDPAIMSGPSSRPLLAVPRWARSLWARIIGPARMLPGLAAAACAVSGAWLLWSLGVALLVAAGLLLLVDARTPRGGA